MRPIVATCGSPQSNLSNWLAHHLSSYLGVFSPAHLLHSLDFVDRMKTLGSCQGKMISLDVTALFTNVPLDFVLDNLSKKEEEGIFVPPIPIHSFLELIKLCVGSTVFTFDGHGFKQKFGVAMGSPLSPVLANLCMEFLESEYILNCSDNIRPLLWYRYVDDVFIIYQKDDECFDNFLNFVNNLIPSIKFTVENEVDNKLPFLDVLVHHNPVTHAFSFKVYRKPTNAEMYIHFFSYHSQQVKSNIIVNMVIRALRICDPCYIDEEFTHIYNVFHSLGYPKYFIDKAFSRARRSFYNPSINKSDTHNRNFLTLPFHHKFIAAKNLFDRGFRDNKGVTLTFKYKNTIRSQVVSNTDRSKIGNSGVYLIPCKDCSSRYVGETGRNLEVRLEEHKRACRLGLENSMVAKHALEISHRINWNQSSIIYKSSNIGKRRVVEGAVINMIETFENNKSFTQEDKFINRLVCQSVRINIDHLNAAPSAQVVSLSPAQALAVTANAGAENAVQHPDEHLGSQEDEDVPINLRHDSTAPALKRSRRLLNRQNPSRGVT